VTAPTSAAEGPSAADERLSDAVLGRVGRLLELNGTNPGAATCLIEHRGQGIDVHLEVSEPLTNRVRQAVAVRVLDAVRSGGTTYGDVEVHVHTQGQ
jgi:hypothetical protein